MGNLEMAEKLGSLARTEAGIADAYEQALRLVDEPVISERLAAYRQAHLSRFQELTDIIIDLGADMPAHPPSGGEVVSGQSSREMPASDLGGVLRFLLDNESAANRAYQEAERWDLSLKAQALVDTGKGDERRHLSFLEEAVKDIEQNRGS